MSPFGPLDSKEEQSEEERLAIARRYREQRGAELRALAQPAVDAEVTAAGEFSTVPIESLAAIPLLGAFFAFAVRARQSRKGLPPNVLLALDERRLHLLKVRGEVAGPEAELVSSWERSEARVASIEPKFMRDQIVLEIAGEEPLKLFAPSLRTNPWGAEIVRELGGDAPAPLDLGEDQPGEA